MSVEFLVLLFDVLDEFTHLLWVQVVAFIVIFAAWAVAVMSPYLGVQQVLNDMVHLRGEFVLGCAVNFVDRHTIRVGFTFIFYCSFHVVLGVTISGPLLCSFQSLPHFDTG